MRSRARNYIKLLSLIDYLLMASIVALQFAGQTWSPLTLLLLLLFVPWWHFLNSYFGVYDSHRLEGFRSASAGVLTSTCVGFASVTPALWIIGSLNLVVRGAGCALIWLALAIGIRWVAYASADSLRRAGHDQRHVLMIGTWQRAQETAERFRRHPEWGLHLVAVGTGEVADREFVRFPSREPISSHLEEVFKTEIVDEILIARPPEAIASEQAAIEVCRNLGRQCRLQLDSEHVPEAREVEEIDGKLTFTVTRPEQYAALGIKRAIDIVAATILLVLLTPVMIGVAILVKMSSPGPIFFRQLRAGLNGRRFVLYKFRSMVDGAEAMLQSVASRNLTGGPTFKDAADLRITPIGRLLRRSSLDELPQLWNVLRGDMSLVGPRPLPVHESAAVEGAYRKRFAMRPGLTCYWQVSGRSNIPFQRWMELDVFYVNSWTPLKDVVLLLRSIPAVVSGRGAY
jgi:exopolysaccharide biosynthesis polyprenyl glycosylphosphotransferase